VAVGYSSVFARGGDVAALPGGLPLVSTPWAVLTAQSLSFVWTLSLNSRSRVRCESLFCLVTLPSCAQKFVQSGFRTLPESLCNDCGQNIPFF
jgi:hypothetical protein